MKKRRDNYDQGRSKLKVVMGGLCLVVFKRFEERIALA